MNKILKFFIKFTLSFFAVAVVLSAALMMFLDPNDYRAELQEMARKQGIELVIEDNLNWQLWPSLSIQLGKTTLTPLITSPNLGKNMAPFLESQNIEPPVIELKQLTASVQWLPLLQGIIAIDGIHVKNAHFNLIVNPQGQNNWQQPAIAPKNQPSTIKTTSSSIKKPVATKPLNLAIQSLILENITLDYHSQPDKLKVSLSQFDLDIKRFNTSNQPFTLQLDWQAAISTAKNDNQAALTHVSSKSLNNPLINKGHLTTTLSIPSDLSTLTVQHSQLDTTLSHKHSDKTESADISLALRGEVNHLNRSKVQPQFKGKLSTQAFNLKKLLSVVTGTPIKTSDANALTKISLSSDINSQQNLIEFDHIILNLDQTQLKGLFSIKTSTKSAASNPKITAKLQVNRINIDRYLPPVTPPSSTTSTSNTTPMPSTIPTSKLKPTKTQTSSSSKSIIPVRLIQSLNLDLQLDLDALQLNELQAQQVATTIIANKGLVRLKNIKAKFYQGEITLKGQLDARQGNANKARLNINGTLTNVQIESLIKDLKLQQDYQLSGKINTKFNGQITGTHRESLLKNLNAKIHINSNIITLKPDNIEQKFCDIINIGKTSTRTKSWANQSNIKNFTASMSLINQQINITEINANIVNLKLGAYGKINMASGFYELIFPLTLTQDWTSTDGCRTRDKFLLGRKLELLRSRGNLNKNSPTETISQNPKGVRQLSKAYSQYALEKSLRKKMGLGEPTTNTGDNSKNKSHNATQPKDLLRGLLDSYLQKKLKSQENADKK